MRYLSVLQIEAMLSQVRVSLPTADDISWSSVLLEKISDRNRPRSIIWLSIRSHKWMGKRISEAHVVLPEVCSSDGKFLFVSIELYNVSY